jgi:hypothetical protein
MCLGSKWYGVYSKSETKIIQVRNSFSLSEDTRTRCCLGGETLIMGSSDVVQELATKEYGGNGGGGGGYVYACGRSKTIGHKKQAHHRRLMGTRTLLLRSRLLNHISLLHPLRRNGDHQGALQALKVEDKLALAARLRTLREPTVLLHRFPFLGDELERRRAILHRARLDEPAADDEARAANTAATVDGGDAASALVVLQHVQDLPDVPDRARETAIWDGEGVVFDRF